MSKKRKNILLILLISIVILMGIGTYAFFTAEIEGNVENDNVVLTSGTLRIEYVEGQALNAEKIIPGWTGTKTFTVKNTGTLSVNYDIAFENVTNTFIKDEVRYSGTCTSNQEYCSPISEIPIDNKDHFIKEDIIIEANEEHNYTITFKFIDTEANQNYNGQANLSGKISVHEANTHQLNSNIAVDMVDAMIPVSWDGETLIKSTTTNENNHWYDYDNQKWANAVLVTNESREQIKSLSVGTPITEENVLAYYTYIPRYRYQLWNTNHELNCLNDNCNAQEIQIIFETKEKEKAPGTSNGQWLTHPSFSHGEEEINGFWVAKFEPTAIDLASSATEESCNSADNVTTKTVNILPNKTSWRCINNLNAYNTSLEMKNKTIYGWNSSEVDTFMLTNQQWGAIAYLSASKYGAYPEEVWNNSNLTFTTGCSGRNVNDYNYAECVAYNTENGVKASTTHNIYGVYDMSGGAWDRVMGTYNNLQGSSGFTTTQIENIPEKYITRYVTQPGDMLNGIGMNYDKQVLGDAVYETSKNGYRYNGTSWSGLPQGAWYADYSYLPYSSAPWFFRGGYRSNTTHAGVFSFRNSSGGAGWSASFRPALVGLGV